MRRDWEGQTRKWEEQTRGQNRKWDEQTRLWNEQWEAHQRQHKQEYEHIHDEIMARAKTDRSIGALGARWGLQSETAFRNAFAGIVQQGFGVHVLNVNEYDDEGIVFGRPDQVQFDAIIENGLVLICELTPSMDITAMDTFERKAPFDDRGHNRQANRLLVISPTIAVALVSGPYTELPAVC